MSLCSDVHPTKYLILHQRDYAHFLLNYQSYIYINASKPVLKSFEILFEVFHLIEYIYASMRIVPSAKCVELSLVQIHVVNNVVASDNE